MIQQTSKLAIERLKDWLRPQQYVRTSEIMRWGSNGGYSNRADRNARFLREEGFLRRLSKEETQKIFGLTRELAYEVLGEGVKIIENDKGQGEWGI